MERRRNARLEINLHCRLTSLRLGSESLQGITENMSRGEVIVRLAADQDSKSIPVLGEPVIVEINLPTNHAFGQKCMQCQTTVVRVSGSEASGTSLVMRIHKMRFQSVEESLVVSGGDSHSPQQLLM